ncbi:GIY-YIG nuclease family protein [Polynucleobacter sp. AP-Kolm-20A-A1]|uniref:GIY-YIG nuclease family protein n=1 Tax=Polynucleobacter sp. AP-Kolm-20A-A1 TaxID=2081041 RepID=UPI001BFE2756|nr:GIY-YIG nuclease family protein [Polynucleobacter sp. AP-Kolm-20A-A1]QWE21447.1 GIY-YIG nuclease family protein [Polynucleobacter sp. AP-Kolm-20A-A1]
MKSGYIYVLVHPSNPNLYKIGVTTRTPKVRLAQHNSDFTKAAGRIVQETGQEWELKEYHPVIDPYWAEKVFWSHIPQSAIPYRGGIEVEIMSWQEVFAGLAAAKGAGLRPQSAATPVYEVAYNVSVRKYLEGRGITLLGQVKSIVSGRNDFECINGHQWRTRPKLVMDGEGCPECGIGSRTLDEMMKITNAGVICLLINPGRPGFISVGAKCGTLERISKEYPWGGVGNPPI